MSAARADEKWIKWRDARPLAVIHLARKFSFHSTNKTWFPNRGLCDDQLMEYGDPYFHTFSMASTVTWVGTKNLS